MEENIIVIDDDSGMRHALTEILKKRGYCVDEAVSAEKGIEKIKSASFDLVLTDVKLPGMSGIEAIPVIKEISPRTEIIVITAHGSKDVAIEAIKCGAYDYFTKPFNLEEMEIIVRRALEKRRLQEEVRMLRQKVKCGDIMEKIIGESEPVKRVKAVIEKVAPLDTTVLITGESGTGKGLVAEIIHALSRRADGPFVTMNCAAIPETLLEGELFGCEKGAYTGAIARRSGKFELAQRGSIFLDEIGEMPLSIQAKLLRAVEEKEIERLGGTRTIPVDTRIISATNRDLSRMVNEKLFRADFYYRLNVASIHMPSLRERKEDLPLLAQNFLQVANVRLGTDLTGISKEAMGDLLLYDWPGNVRELANLIERASILSTGGVLTGSEVRRAFERSIDLAMPDAGASEEKKVSLAEILDEVERSLITDALAKHGGVQIKAAEALGLSPKNLWKKIRKHRPKED